MQAKSNNFTYVLKIFLPLLLICAVVAGIISGLQVLTRDQIAANEAMVEQKKEEEKLRAIDEIYGEGVEFEKLKALPEGIDEIRTAVDVNGKTLATVTLTVKGYSTGLQVFVAFGAEGEVRRVMVLASKETTGIGSKVSDAGYLAGYEGQSGEIVFGNGIDKIAGATISSKGVLGAVNTAREALESLGIIEKGGAN
ncbi:MAG: FMN-binding protein [Clostridia bacterium]|nr:FMN-binding protein [Clostridia bacterium]